MNAQLKEWLKALGGPEKAAIVLLVVWLVGSFAGVPALFQLVIGLATTVAIVWAGIRIGMKLLRKAIWRLRHRLLVAFLFIAVIPIGLVLAFVSVGVRLVAGQVGLYLVYSRLDQQLETMQSWATAIVRAEPAGSSRLRAAVEDEFPGAQILVESAGTSSPGHGIALKDGVLNGWARDLRDGRRVTILTPLTRDFFQSLDPDLGEVSLIPIERRSQFFAAVRNGAAGRRTVGIVPPKINFADLDVRWGAPLQLKEWNAESKPLTAVLGIHTRLSAILGKLVAPGTDSGNLLLIVLYLIAGLIFVAEIVSLVVGFSITRTMTAAVHDLYEGTQRVMQGDFSHRIPVRGSEQIADLSRSFNTMTENVESLLKVSKEKERMQAELDVARRVQQQLFPSEMPKLDTLQLRAICQPARQVSGDYYDYQALPDQKVVLALGDVAGKGISAALLMASLQSTLRVQLREWQNDASTERLVTGLNQHLFLNTAPEKYATFFLALYDEKNGMLEYTNAGHLPPLLVRKGAVTRLDINGTVVGAFAKSKYDSSRLQLEPGDLLVCYTDGVSELENEFGEMFGEDRLADVLVRAGDAGLEQVEAAVLQAANQFCAEAQDDLTMLMVRRR